MKIRSLLTILFVMGFGIFMMMLGDASFSDSLAPVFLWIISSFIASTVIWSLWNLELKVRERQASPKQTETLEKKKREHIDSVLRDLSDEDLLRLRQRLMDGTINDERLEDALVGEDGEISYRGQR